MYAPSRLEVDSGNTLLKWRVIDLAGNVLARGFVDDQTDLQQIFANAEYLDRIGSALISSVSRTELVTAMLKACVPQLDSDRIIVVRPRPEMAGVVFAYEDCSQLGVDRCLAMIAAYRQFSDGVLVIDCGSAITADIVSAEGIHLGGYIFPGLRLLKSSLLRGTARIATDSAILDQPHGTFSGGPGVNTEDCVDNGIHLMIQSTMLSLGELALKRGVTNIVMTGGDGEFVSAITGLKIHYKRDLVFDGLGIINPFGAMTTNGGGLL